jgi:hypothetical protein
MHYIGMLAFQLPVPTDYDRPMVLLSLCCAFAASAVALFVVSHPEMSFSLDFAGRTIDRRGIAATHYVDMAATRLPAMYKYSVPLVISSICADDSDAACVRVEERDCRPARQAYRLGGAEGRRSSTVVDTLDQCAKARKPDESFKRRAEASALMRIFSSSALLIENTRLSWQCVRIRPWRLSGWEYQCRHLSRERRSPDTRRAHPRHRPTTRVPGPIANARGCNRAR